jgi:predicted outer membrane repeat protein
VTLVAAPNLPVFIHQGGNLQLIGLTLTGGRTAGCGGAVQIVEGNAELTNMRLLDSRAQWGGGLCVMSGSTANVYNSYISGNVASGGGGGIYAGGNV